MAAPGQLIESICGAVLGEDEPPSWFKVGVSWQRAVAIVDDQGVEHPIDWGHTGRIVYTSHLVSRIDHREENRGDHGVGWFDVWVGDQYIIASLNERHVTEVYYQIPTGSEAG